MLTGAAVRLTGSRTRLRVVAGLQRGRVLPGGRRALDDRVRQPGDGALPDRALARRLGGRDEDAGPRPVGEMDGRVTFIGTIAQAPLGLLTIRLDLHPLMVATHFLLALVVLATATVVAVEAWGNVRGRIEVAPRWLRLVGLVLALACGILVVTGTLSTAAGPTGDSAEIDRFWNLLDAVYVHVRATAAFGISFLLLLAWLVRNGSAPACSGPRPSACSCSSSCRWCRRAAMAERAALVARPDPRRPRCRRLGLDRGARDRSLADAA